MKNLDANNPTEALEFLEMQTAKLQGDRQFHLGIQKCIDTIRAAITPKQPEHESSNGK